MVYFKVLLNSKRLKTDNVYPIEVRITHNRKNTTISTGIRVHIDFWEPIAAQVKHKHLNALAYNKTISEVYSKIQNVAYRLLDEGTFTFDTLKTSLNGSFQATKQPLKVTFKAFADGLIDDMIIHRHAGNAIVYRTATNRLLAYVSDSGLRLADIDYTLLDGFRNHLGKTGVKQNTISNYFRTLRAIYNKAIKAKAIDRAHYPFLDIPIKTERTAKRAISITDLLSLWKSKPKPLSQQWHAKNVFFISFCLIGASFTDLAYLKLNNIVGGRLTYRRRKTGKELDILLRPEVLQILQHYTGLRNTYLLPILPNNLIEDSMRAKAIITQAIKVTNKYLTRLASDCRMNADVTTYVARHTWATTAKKLGVPIEVIAEAMGHEHGNKITNIYLDSFDQSVIDEVNGKVIGLLR